MIIDRPQYVKELLSFKDSDIIKVITGVRRCGKSTLMELYKNALLKQGVDEKQIQFIKLEEIENEEFLDYHKLHHHIIDHLVPGKQNYIFFG